MKYYNLRSVLQSNKTAIPIKNSCESFCIADPEGRPFIEPAFDKCIYEQEHPTIILVSAVGATGKTTLASRLSKDTGLPLFDLGKHRPVGASALTGLLTEAFDITKIGDVLQGLANGTFGVIIDGIDEGRSKTAGKAFDAFLDDIAKLCNKAPKTVFVILGRTKILDECWLHLSNKGINVALISIEPFSVDDARLYIDTFSDGNSSPHKSQYLGARDKIIEMLGSAFHSAGKKQERDFNSFIGYPPVLDSIATLLRDEPNYHKLLETLNSNDGKNVEVSLLKKIGQFILQRERMEKVIPNIVNPLIAGLSEEDHDEATKNVYSFEEQCARVVSMCLKKPYSYMALKEPKINEKYEEQLVPFVREHPFISNGIFRNHVFQSLMIATLICSKEDAHVQLACEYSMKNKYSYHLVYMLDGLNEGLIIPRRHINTIVQSSFEFSSMYSNVEINIEGPDSSEGMESVPSKFQAGIYVDILIGKDEENKKSFVFQSDVSQNECIVIGPRLAGLFIDVPCKVEMMGDPELEVFAPIEIEARQIGISGKNLILRANRLSDGNQDIILKGQRMESGVDEIELVGANFQIVVGDKSGLTYPIIQHVEIMAPIPTDPNLRKKYFRLKRILLEFRSHSKGSLAKYKHKIEHERVLKDSLGDSVLKRLVKDGILRLSGNFYHLDPGGLNEFLGVSWLDLRKGQSSEKLFNFLRSIV